LRRSRPHPSRLSTSTDLILPFYGFPLGDPCCAQLPFLVPSPLLSFFSALLIPPSTGKQNASNPRMPRWQAAPAESNSRSADFFLFSLSLFSRPSPRQCIAFRRKGPVFVFVDPPFFVAPRGNPLCAELTHGHVGVPVPEVRGTLVKPSSSSFWYPPLEDFWSPPYQIVCFSEFALGELGRPVWVFLWS